MTDYAILLDWLITSRKDTLSASAKHLTSGRRTLPGNSNVSANEHQEHDHNELIKQKQSNRGRIVGTSKVYSAALSRLLALPPN